MDLNDKYIINFHWFELLLCKDWIAVSQFNVEHIR